jgi:hypothetical protein
LETRFSEAGAAESLEIGKIAVGSSNRSGRLCKLYGIAFNKSGRHCKASDEINLICLMYLDYLDLCVSCAIVAQMPSLKAIKRYPFWRHGVRKQALLSRWELAKWQLDRPTDQGV